MQDAHDPGLFLPIARDTSIVETENRADYRHRQDEP